MCFRVAAEDSGKPVVDAAFGEVMVTCEKIAWLLREGERHLRPERRSSGVMVLGSCPMSSALSCLWGSGVSCLAPAATH